MDKKADFEPLSARDKKAEKEAKKAEAAAKRAAKKAEKDASATADKLSADNISLTDITDVSDSSKQLTKEQQRVASNRAVTGVLASTAAARDVKFQSFSVAVGGKQLVSDCDLELTQGCRYGLLGDNGSGKSNVLAAIAQREVPLPAHISVFHLHEEAPPSELSGVQAVIQHVVDEVARLEAMSESILEECGPEDERLEAINDRLSELDPTGAEPRARKILSGLGFADHLVPMDRETKHMSGGWRMRVSLAQALFAAPELLLLDEPTNHLGLRMTDSKRPWGRGSTPQAPPPRHRRRPMSAVWCYACGARHDAPYLLRAALPPLHPRTATTVCAGARFPRARALDRPRGVCLVGGPPVGLPKVLAGGLALARLFERRLHPHGVARSRHAQVLRRELLQVLCDRRGRGAAAAQGV